MVNHLQHQSSQKIWSALQHLGLPFEEFAGQSFRIGEATKVAQAGVEDSVIHLLGR